MVEEKEKNLMDYLPIIIGILLIVIVIYVLMTRNESPSLGFHPTSLFGVPEYNISSAFGVVK